MKLLYDEAHRFAAGFDPDTGFYCRTNQRAGVGQDTGRDPFMASLPHLLDVGIMGHCTHGLSGRCQQSGIECYQSEAWWPQVVSLPAICTQGSGWGLRGMGL